MDDFRPKYEVAFVAALAVEHKAKELVQAFVSAGDVTEKLPEKVVSAANAFREAHQDFLRTWASIGGLAPGMVAFK